jgi:hypothetical protein
MRDLIIEDKRDLIMQTIPEFLTGTLVQTYRIQKNS